MKLYCASLLCLVVYLCYMDVTTAQEMNDLSIVDRTLSDPRAINGHLRCLTGKGTCTGPQIMLKTALPEVILRNCRNCSPQQAQNAQKLTNFLQTRYPDVWAMLIRKYRGV